MKIRINSIEDAIKLSKLCNQFKDGVDVTDGHFIVDGKSQMGLLAISTSKDLTIDILTDNIYTRKSFEEVIKEFVVR